MHHHSEMADAVGWLSSYGIVLSLFLAGLIGSITHCVGMCSPFVLAQTANRMDAGGGLRGGEWGRLRAAALAPYHFGRATTYSLLGAVAGLGSSSFVEWTGVRWLTAGLLAVGAWLFLAMALGRLGALPQFFGGRAMSAMSRVARPLTVDPRGWRGYALGLLLGLLPCGLVYAALATAAGAGSVILGAAAMAAFAAGTAPALIATGFAGAAAAGHWRRILSRAPAPLLIVNALLLAVFAVQRAGF
jgi:sulfite exporter TauE/SafE